jgi:quinoprotein glucose dehydrogenase
VLFTETQRLAADLVPQEVALDLVLAGEAKKSERIDALLAARAQARAADPDLAPFLDGLWGGDAAAGEKLFREKTELTCLKCHRTAEGAEGGNVGPVLAGVGKRVARLKLAESITAPNRAIAKGYQATLLVLADERVVEGRVLSADDAAVRVLDAEGQTIEIPRSEVVDTRAGLSAMPQGLAQHLSRTEMRDLIEYLAGL